MIIHNQLPHFIDCLKNWESLPSRYEFESRFVEPSISQCGDFFEGFHPFLKRLDWRTYRDEALTLDPVREEERVRRHLKAVEDLFGFPLEGEIVLFGSFTAMDGYARFDRGTHKVFLGVDESHAQGNYLDVLITHELTHVARESRPPVWEAFGLNPKMTQSEFTEHQPVIEHLMGEGFSCVVSEILVPGEDPWNYVYQEQESLRYVYENGKSLDRAIHREISSPDGDYGRLYGSSTYTPRMPVFSHYVWAWQWVKQILQDHAGGDPRRLVAHSSRDFIENALKFELKIPR